MKWVLTGHEYNGDLPLPSTEWFYYLCARDFGWTPEQVDEQPAALVDWLIAFRKMERNIEREHQDEHKYRS